MASPLRHMEFGPHVAFEERTAFFGDENQMKDYEAQGLRHGDGAGFQPFFDFRCITWGVAPVWYGLRRWRKREVRRRGILQPCDDAAGLRTLEPNFASGVSAPKARPYTSLGRRPRVHEKNIRGPTARPICFQRTKSDANNNHCNSPETGHPHLRKQFGHFVRSKAWKILSRESFQSSFETRWPGIIREIAAHASQRVIMNKRLYVENLPASVT